MKRYRSPISIWKLRSSFENFRKKLDAVLVHAWRTTENKHYLSNFYHVLRKKLKRAPALSNLSRSPYLHLVLFEKGIFACVVIACAPLRANLRDFNSLRGQFHLNATPQSAYARVYVAFFNRYVLECAYRCGRSDLPGRVQLNASSPIFSSLLAPRQLASCLRSVGSPAHRRLLMAASAMVEYGARQNVLVLSPCRLRAELGQCVRIELP